MKYAGSKERMARDLIAAMDIGDAPYAEPFVGGFNVIDKVQTKGGRFANDVNAMQMVMVHELLKGWTPEETYTREQYDNAGIGDDLTSLHELGYLRSQLSYCGQVFGGYQPRFYRDRGFAHDAHAEVRNALMAQVPLLKGVDLQTGDYSQMRIPDGSVVYCDPDVIDFRFWNWVETTISQRNARVYVTTTEDHGEPLWVHKGGTKLYAYV